MTAAPRTLPDHLIPDEEIAAAFDAMREILRELGDSKVPGSSPIIWSNSTLEEVTPNVIRSLRNKYAACAVKGFNTAKVAGLYTFWIAKLKPIFSPFSTSRGINEFAAINVGLAYIYERLGLEIDISNDIQELCDSLRYHTSSPHALMHIFQLLIDREQVKNNLEDAENKLVKHGIV